MTTQTPSGTATDFVASLIRTYSPNIAALVLSWLIAAHLTIRVGNLSQGFIQSIVTVVLSALWYFMVRALELKWPKLGVLLGVPKAPSYTPLIATVENGVANISSLPAAPSDTSAASQPDIEPPALEPAPPQSLTPDQVEPDPVPAAATQPADAPQTPAAPQG